MFPDHAGPKVEVLGASKLTDLYGYWPSFHDATVESILIERVGPTVTIRFETCDMACDGDTVREPDRRARVVLRWHEVEDLELRGIDPEEHNWIDGLTFGLRDGGIRSELLLMDGLHGWLDARRVEVVDVEPFTAQNSHN
jgi:hypothetical protein